MRGFFLVLLLFFYAASQGQDLRCKDVWNFNSEFALDSLTVLPSSIEVKNSAGIRVVYNPNTGNVFLEAENPPDSIEICYQTLPFALHRTYMRRDVAEIGTEEEYSEARSPATAPAVVRDELFHSENLYKSGSLSRSISFGNAQDLVVNSHLNLQLEGKLTDEINVRASITDQNVPYQPEGNTAQVQDFDNVFIQLYNEKFDLIAGDVVLKNKESHFLRYYKNVQGGLLNLNYEVGNNGIANTSFGASMAKGKFASVMLEVDEGVAGPYRVEIPGASRLAIILANSEKVFLDGKQLQRGYDYDYVIDYDKAEITFTSRIMITQYSRVRMDVEYSDQHYGRSITAFNHYQSHNKLDFFVNYYSEKDNRSNPLKYDLSDQDKLELAQLGDDVGNAFQAGFSQAEYNPQKVQYRLVDTVTSNAVPVQVFTHAANDNVPVYDVVFSEVNFGEGDYIRTRDLMNGVVFQWVSPEDGQKQGNYIPARKIDLPVKKSMTNGGVSYSFNDYERVFGEVALSVHDKNLYSELDASDDSDFAYIAGMESKGRKISDKLKLNTGISFEKNGRYFIPVDRFRYVEFDRDWNYNPLKYKDASEENILRAEAALIENQQNMLSYELVKRKRGEVIDGTQHFMKLNKTFGRIHAQTQTFLMENQALDFTSTWHRFNADINYQSEVFVPGYQFNIDRNTLRDAFTDSITHSEMNFFEHVAYLKSNDSLKTRFRLDYAYREDQLPLEGKMELSNISQTTSFTVNHDARNHQLEALIAYRKNESLFDGAGLDEETINSRLDWHANLFQNHVRSGLNYAVGSGRELRKDFMFIEVPAGQGTHTWRDDNNNGIQELNEFYLAVNPEEKNFAKIFVPTNEYVFAYLNNFNYRLNADMPMNWMSEGGMKSFLSKFSNITSLTSQRKITDPAVEARFLPFGNEIAEEELISSRFAFNSRLFFNRRSPKYGIDVAFSQFENKQFLTGGFEKRSNKSWGLNFRSNFMKIFSVRLKLEEGDVENASDFLEGKNFLIQRYEASPEVAWQPNVHFRLSGEYTYHNKQVTSSEDEYSQIHEGGISAIYSKASDMSVNTLFKISQIKFEGMENSPVGYELLEALRPGRNYIWNVMLQKKLVAGLQLSVNYEGRKSAESRLVHIGRMQVSVLF